MSYCLDILGNKFVLDDLSDAIVSLETRDCRVFSSASSPDAFYNAMFALGMEADLNGVFTVHTNERKFVSIVNAQKEK